MRRRPAGIFQRALQRRHPLPVEPHEHVDGDGQRLQPQEDGHQVRALRHEEHPRGGEQQERVELPFLRPSHSE